jgi:hypothetical protein
MRNFSQRCANCLLMFLVLYFILSFSYSYYRSQIVPIVQITGTDELFTPTIHAGEDLVFHRKVFREKICRTDVDNFILYINAKGEEVVVFRDRMIGGWSRLGVSAAEIHVKTPNNLPPRRYILRTVVTACGGTGSMSDDIKFDVIP